MEFILREGTVHIHSTWQHIARLQFWGEYGPKLTFDRFPGSLGSSPRAHTPIFSKLCDLHREEALSGEPLHF